MKVPVLLPKIFNYPFDIARCGMENFKTHPRSLHSLAYFYNYCLSKCSFTHVMKWDGDMLLPYKLQEEFKLFYQRISHSMLLKYVSKFDLALHINAMIYNLCRVIDT